MVGMQRFYILLTASTLLIVYTLFITQMDLPHIVSPPRREADSINKFHTTQYERKARIKDLCNINNSFSQGRIEAEYLQWLLVDDKHKVIYCPVNKVGGTTWKRRMMASIVGNSPRASFVKIHDQNILRRNGIRQLSSYGRKKAQTMLLSFFKFLFVRHPISRFTSAYQDKLVNPSETRFVKFTRDIIKYTRGKHPQDSSQNVSISEVLKYIEYQDRKNIADRHWRPIAKLCNPCKVSYDFIGKMETFAEDTNFVLASAFHNMSLVTESERHSTNSKNRTRMLLAQISEDTKKGLMKLYKSDFDLFGYSYSNVFGTGD